MRAALFLRGPSRWRSRQLSLTLSCPPTNHLANGSFHSRTRFQRLNQCSRSACLAQKPSGSSWASRVSFSNSSLLLMCAFAAKSAGGGKLRVSLRMLVMFEEVGEVMMECSRPGDAVILKCDRRGEQRGG